MKKTIITNKITKCCTLPFSVAYWWVYNLTLNSESDKQFIISNMSQMGTISIDAWKVLINSGSIEDDAVLTKEEFLAWFDCGRQPSCEQLKIIIESYKLGNWIPETNKVPDNIATLDGVFNGVEYKGNALRKVDNIADLRALEGVEGQEVILLGYYTPGDKEHVLYKYTKLDDLIDDGGSVIKTNSGTWIAVFNGVCDVKDFGAIKDTDCTANINSALKAVDEVSISEDYIVNPSGRDGNQYTGGIKPRTGNVIVFKNGAKLYINANSLTSYAILNLTKVNNVVIHNPYVIGDVETHTGESGEWGHGIVVYGCEDIEIHNLKAEYCWGDGFAIGSYVRGEDIHPNKRVKLLGVSETNYCRRNGTSIISCQELEIDSLIAKHNGTIRGTNPRYGVDIEPNNGGNDIIDVRIHKLYTYGNSEGGLEIVPAYMQDSRYVTGGIFNCVIDSYVSDNDGVTTENRGSLRIAFADNTLAGIVETKQINGVIQLNDVVIMNSVKKSLTITRASATGLNIKFGNLSIINPYTTEDTQNQRTEKNAIHMQTQPTQLTYGFVSIDNLLIDSKRNNLIVGVMLQAANDPGNPYKNFIIKSYEHLGTWVDPVEVPTYGVCDESVIVHMSKPVVLTYTNDTTMNNYAVVDEMTLIVKTQNKFLTLPNLGIVKRKKLNIIPDIPVNTIYAVQGRNEDQPIDIQPRSNRILYMQNGSSVSLNIVDGMWKIMSYSGIIYNREFPVKGTTAQRPLGLVAANVGFVYYDTTIGNYISWSGSNWNVNAIGSYINVTSNSYDLTMLERMKTIELTPSSDCIINVKSVSDNMVGAIVIIRNNVNFNITLKADTGVTIMGSTTYNQIIMSKRNGSQMLVCNGLNQWRLITLNSIAGAVPSVTTSDATDLTTVIALTNELKSKINSILSTEVSAGQRIP